MNKNELAEKLFNIKDKEEFVKEFKNIIESNRIKSKLYKFRQNNSGGYIHINDVEDEIVYIEALNANHAWQLALELFDHSYCQCCGTRWSEPYEDDAIDSEDEIVIHSYEDSNYLEIPLKEALEKKIKFTYDKKGGMIIHYLNGVTKKYNYRDSNNETI